MYSPRRITYLNRLLRLIKIRSGILRTSESWRRRRLQAYDLLFLFLYGLPIRLQLDAAGNVLARYLPNYESRYPADDRPRRVVEAAKRWISDPTAACRPGLSDELGEDEAFKTHVHFLSAIGSVADLLQSGRDEPLWTAAKLTRIIQSCIHQRIEDVWMADDPEAAKAWDRAQQIMWELGLARESNDTERLRSLDAEWHEIMERVAVARRLDIDNVACWAVERRELYILVEWLHPIAETYPDSVRPSPSEWRSWREDTWEYSVEQDSHQA